ncbi:MAG: hypothetical protein ABUK01_01615 [Leptospirales bacterium]
MKIKTTHIIALFLSFAVYISCGEMPEYAKKKILYKKYELFIANMDYLVKSSRNLDELAAKVKKMKQPKNLIYLGLEIDSDETRDIIKKVKWSSNIFYVSMGAGYGSIQIGDITVPIVIIDKTTSSVKYLEGYTIYLERKQD